MISRRKEREALEFGAHESLIVIWRILILAILKLLIGFYTGMVVLVADALASFSDILGIIASYIGLKISEKSATKEFTYGYYKVETVSSLIVSATIIYFGIEIFLDSLGRFRTLESSSNHILGLIVVVVAVIQSTYLAKRLQRAGKKINSLSLINCAKDKTIDIYVQFAVLIGIGAAFFKISYIEGMVGMGISIMTLKVGYESAKESLYFLLDYFDDQELIEKIRKTILKSSKIVQNIDGIKMRRAGTYIFGEAVLEIDPYIQVKDIRENLKNLKAKIIELDPYLKNFSLLISIPKPGKLRVAVPVLKDKGLISIVSTDEKDTRAYVFVDIKRGKIFESYGKKFNYKTADFKGMTDFFLHNKTDVIINNNMHSLLFYNLRHLNQILVYPNFYNVTSVENTVKLLILDT